MDIIKYIFRYLKPFYLKMALGFIVKFIGTVMDLFLPMILAYIIDEVAPTKNTNAVLLWGGVMTLCAFTAVTFNIIANRMAAAVARATTQKVRYELYRKISYLSSRQLDEFTIPSLESRLTSDTYNIHQMINMTQRLGVRAPILLIGGIAITLIMDPILSLVLISTLPLIALIVFTVTTRGTRIFTSTQGAIDRVTRVVRENISGIRIIKALTCEDEEIARFKAANDNLNERETKASSVMSITSPAMSLLLNLGFVGVIIVGAFRVDSGITHGGTILAFMQYFTIILNAMMSVTRIFIMMSRGGASAGRIAAVLDAESDMKVLEDLDNDCNNDGNFISFDHVTFSYQGKKNDLEDINFSLKKGETLGIIGPTGSGKSTLIQLLLRFYDPDKGTVKVNGRDIRTYSHDEFTKMFGVALQSDFLFADSIKENIDFGRNLSDEQIAAATTDAQAASFISDTENGLNHQLAIKGSNISGGQKQRLLISRALAANPEILILDDSSSALDYVTDSNLRAAIAKNHTGNTTKIIVAQRISSIKHADLILVLEDGKLTASGKHEDLLAKSDLYKEISESQMGGAALE